MILDRLKRGVDVLRQPDRNPRCYELTDQERLARITEWNNSNVWNTPDLADQDQINEYWGA